MKAITKIIMVLSLLLLPSLGFADDSGLFTPVATDKMMLSLNSIFGQLGVFGATGNDPLINLIKIINSACLIVGGLFTGWYILHTIKFQAHDGKIIGRLSPFHIIRFPVCVALLLPVINGGYNTAEVLVGQVIKMGIGLADSANSEFMSNQNLISVAQSGLIKPQVSNLAYNLFASYACMHLLEQDKADYPILHPNTSAGITIEKGMNNTIYKFGDKNGTVDSCGYMTVSNWQAPPVSSGSVTGYTNIVQMADAIPIMQAITQRNQEDVQKLMSKMDSLSSKLVSSNSPADPNEIAQAVADYQNDVNTFASQKITSLDQFSQLKKSADTDGFIFLGAYYQKISKLIDLTNSALANVPVATGVTSYKEISWDKYSVVMKNIQRTVDLSNNGTLNFGVGNEEGGTNYGWLDVAKSMVKDVSVEPLVKKLFTSTASFTFDASENALLKVERIGGWTATVVGSVGGGILVLTSSAGNIPGIGLALIALFKLFVPPLLVFSFYCLYVVPMIPFFIWFGCIVALMISYAETIVGASLWVLAVMLEGHDAMGQGANGFKQILSIFLKPLLMVMGFVVSTVFLQVLGTLASSVFADVWNLSQSDSNLFIYVIGMFAMPFMYVALMSYLVIRCFNIIHIIPDQVMNWIGGHGVSMSGAGQEGANVGAGAGAGFGASLGAMASKFLPNNLGENERKNPIGDKDKNGNFNKIPEAKNNVASHDRKSVVQAESNIMDNLSMSDNGYSGTKAKKVLDGAFDMVGGRNSKEGEKFINQLNDSVERKPNADFQKQVDSAMNKHLIESFGSGSGRFIAQAGNGYTTQEAKQTKGLFESAMNKMNSAGIPTEQGKEIITKVNDGALNRFETDTDSVKNGGSMGLNDYFVSEINKELPISQKFFEPTIDKSENNS
ncbi:DotA/TraY family protein [Burkholderia contaminans]|uniref:DotA/TraY family protein n=1 Tax=Burkholderia contaminans TaxID=488447 RepID=UPI000A7FF0B3|nr:DotA/TraY family protein [Burkholderia contaminans]MDN8026754.1 DotA/TraY family protein [Burkholderia contaminans]